LASGGDLNERAIREEMAYYCALLWERGLVRGSSGNLSVRLDNGDLLVTPSQRSLRKLNVDELVHLDPAGTPVAGGRPTSELPLHLAAYAAREDIRTVMHTHPTYCVVWSKTGALFARDTVGAQESLGEIAWTPFAPAGSSELARITADAFARRNDTVIMERHGISAVAQTLERAFVQSDLAEEAARVAYLSSFLVQTR
jgi:L-fuculose-phosphate aldolase